MRPARLLLATATALASAAVVVVACGGRQLDPNAPADGFLDDAGVYHLPDGALLIPGAGCVGFEASAFVDLDGPIPEVHCDADTQCLWIPKGYPLAKSSCWIQPAEADVGSTCILGGNYAAVIPCNPGVAGDEYCVALFQQFVSVPGVAAGRCAACREFPTLTECKQGGCVTGCKSYAVLVERAEASPRCENPCQP